MKRKGYTEEQIIRALKQHESGIKVADICRELGISEGTFYRWKSVYGGMEVSEAKRLKELESENARPHSSLGYQPPAVFAKNAA